MGKKHKILLTIDGIINLALGILLLLFPLGMAEVLGVPKPNLNFYPTLLGAVIFGIGIALLVERYGFSRNIRGLGLGGAIAINLCGAVVLLIWLITTPLNIPLRGSVILWSIAIIVLGVGLVEIFAKSWVYREPDKNLPREDLLKLTQVYAKNWLAHDGCWFLAAEEKFGMETAMELDAKSWERFAVVEARRIMKEFEITSNGGLKALEKALQFRLYAAINRQEIEWVNDNKIIFRMLECRVQKTRRQKNLPDFPCKSVGLVEFSHFAKTVDPRIQTKCIACPPDPVTDFYCGWEFTIDE